MAATYGEIQEDNSEACHTAVLATVISHLDYVNAIMVGLPEKTYCKAAACSEYGCKSCVKKRQVHQFKRQSPDPTLAAHQELDQF